MALVPYESKVAEFLKELEDSKTDKSWEECHSSSKLTVHRKLDTASGLYRLKMIGKIPADLKTCHDVLLDPTLRKAWDSIIMTMTSKDLGPQADPSCSLSIVYTAIKSPIPLKNREFCSQRVVQDLPDKKQRIIFDVSVESDLFPRDKHFIRADTKFSGLLFEPCEAPDWETKKPVPGYAYQCLSLFDPAGDIPKKLVNLISAVSTADWFNNYSKACKKHLKGTLLKQLSPEKLAKQAAKKEKEEAKLAKAMSESKLDDSR